MPSSITHLLIAEDASRFFPPPVRKSADAHPDYFFLGAQGPDPYFFLKICSREHNLGKALHGAAYQTFAAFRDRYRKFPDGRLAAYLAGYVSHYATDVAFHPFVYGYLKETNARGMVHQRMENDWDVFFFRTKRHREAEYFPVPFDPRTIIQDGVLYPLVCSLDIFKTRRPPSERAFQKTVKRFYRFVAFFHGACYRKQRRWQRAERALGFKPRLSCLYPREFPAVLPDEATADRFYETAVAETARLVPLFFSENPLPRDCFNKNLHTGK